MKNVILVSAAMLIAACSSGDKTERPNDYYASQNAAYCGVNPEAELCDCYTTNRGAEICEDYVDGKRPIKPRKTGL